MKYLKSYESIKSPTLKDVFRDCKYFIDETMKCNKGSFLIRGMHDMDNYDICLLKSTLDYRLTLNTPGNVHDYMNKLFIKKFGWKVRNGAFCFGWNIDDSSSDIDIGYGSKTFIVFPVGDFNIVYHPEIYDLYYEIDSVWNGDDDKFIRYKPELRKIVNEYKTGSLEDAIESGNEISIKCDEYYIIQRVNIFIR